MAIENVAQLKSYFETGDMPTQQEFYNFLESYYNKLDDTIPGFTDLGKILFVSDNFGDNSTAKKGNTLRPWKTLTQAKASAFSGDLIYVLDGFFNELNLLKNNVNWYWSAGTGVLYTGSSDGAIFDDSVGTGSGGSVICKITGHGEFTRNGTGNEISFKTVYYTDNGSTDIFLECYELGGLKRTIYQVDGNLLAHVKNSISSDNAGVIHIDAGTIIVHTNTITNPNGTGHIIRAMNGTIIIYADIISNPLGNFNCLYPEDGTIYAYVREITNTTSFAGKIGATGKLYIYFDIIQTTDFTAIDGSINGTLYLKGRRIENNAFAMWTIICSNGTIDVLEVENLGGSAFFANTNFTVKIINCELIANDQPISVCILRGTGTVEIISTKIINNFVPVPAHGIEYDPVSTNTLILRDVVIVVANAASNSIFSVAPQNPKTYSGWANTIVAPIVIELVSMLLIDPVVE